MISKSGALSVVAWVELLHLSALSEYHTRFAYRSSFFSFFFFERNINFT